MPHGDPVTASGLPDGPFLSTTPARPWDQRLALAMVAISLAAFGLAVPFADVKWPEATAFIPACQAALIINDLITAVLLISQFRQLRAPSLLVLGAGYLFDSVIISAHVMSFPGVFSPAGLLGGHEQTAPWLYVFWHGLFPIFVIVYAAIAHRAWDRPVAPALVGRAVTIAVLIALVVAGGAILLATALVDQLRPLIASGDYTRIARNGASLGGWLVTLIAPV